jgi:hypothetical protein
MMGPDFRHIKVKEKYVGGIDVTNIDGDDNVVRVVHIQPGDRNNGFAKKSYIAYALDKGDIKSGEQRNSGDKSSFFSNDAKNLWNSLAKHFKIDKLPIQGDKFRFVLTKDAIEDAYKKAKETGDSYVTDLIDDVIQNKTA